jgi:hypothetical protein
MRANQSIMYKKYRLPEDLAPGDQVLLLGTVPRDAIVGMAKVTRFTPRGKVAILCEGENTDSLYKPTRFGWKCVEKFSERKVVDPAREPWSTKWAEHCAAREAENKARDVRSEYLSECSVPPEGVAFLVEWLRTRRDRLLQSRASWLQRMKRDLDYQIGQVDQGQTPSHLSLNGDRVAQQDAELRLIDDTLWQLRFHCSGTEVEMALARAKQTLGEPLSHYDEEALELHEKITGADSRQRQERP